MPRLNESVGDRSSLFDLKKYIQSVSQSVSGSFLGSGLSYTLPCLRPGPINQSSNPNTYIAVTVESQKRINPIIMDIHK